jgi:hypothetical protein
MIYKSVIETVMSRMKPLNITSASKKSTQINGEKMRELADYIKSNIPGCGFALITFEANSINNANYVSNVQDDFMIHTLEKQLKALKNGTTFSTPEDNMAVIRRLDQANL